MDTLDYIAINALENIDRIIDCNPYSTDIVIEKVSTSGQFGYEDYEKEEEFTTRGIIKYNPERRFLKKIGILTEGDLPILGMFKNSDKFKKNDIIKQITKDIVDDQIVEIERKFEIVDIISYGDLRTGKKVFKLAPIRG